MMCKYEDSIHLGPDMSYKLTSVIGPVAVLIFGILLAGLQPLAIVAIVPAVFMSLWYCWRCGHTTAVDLGPTRLIVTMPLRRFEVSWDTITDIHFTKRITLSMKQGHDYQIPLYSYNIPPKYVIEPKRQHFEQLLHEYWNNAQSNTTPSAMKPPTSPFTWTIPSARTAAVVIGMGLTLEIAVAVLHSGPFFH
jgi:hypothetical protein